VGVHDLDLRSLTYLLTRVSHGLTKLNTKQAAYVLVYKCKAILGILLLPQRRSIDNNFNTFFKRNSPNDRVSEIRFS
jgi:hypothetical protein